jgi:glyoxylase-like metal-dependent hydrolase (beta-lactamase superfamily II)
LPREHRRREPAPGVFRLILPLPFPGLDRVNAYLLADDQGPTLVDTGIHDPDPGDDHGWNEVVAALAACDVTPSDVARVVVTHSHIDHYGMAGRFVAESDAELWMHEAARADLDYYRHPEDVADELADMLADHGVEPVHVKELTAYEDWGAFISEIVEADRWLRGDEVFSAGGRDWRVVHTPGHARSHVCLWANEDRILIAGDHLLATITPHIDFRRNDASDPLGDYLESLRTIEELEPGLVLPGHGRPFEDGAERARVIARHHDRRLGSILQVIRREARSANDITDEIFGTTLLNYQRRLALGESLAHLAHLRRNGEVERTRAPDGTYLYRKASRRPAAGDR